MTKTKGRPGITAVLFLVFAFTLIHSPAFSASAEDYFNYGTKAYLAGNYANAIKYYKMAIKLDIRNPRYYSAIGDCYKQSGQIEKAMLYYEYADKLGGVPQEDFYEKQKKEIQKKANIVSVSPLLVSGGIVNLCYERRITDGISASVDAGYIWALSLLSIASSGSSISGFGYMLGGRVNFFFENKALAGIFAGPEVYYYNGGITAITTDSYGVQTEIKSSMSITTMGGHVGYRLILDGGLSLDGVVAVNYITSGVINFGSTAITLGMVLPMLGLNAGYAF